MRNSRDHILTSHAGSLPRPDALIAANQAPAGRTDSDEARFQQQLQAPRWRSGAPAADARHRCPR